LGFVFSYAQFLDKQKQKSPFSKGNSGIFIKRHFGGGGGNRTRVRKSSTDSSTYLVLPFDLTNPTRTHTLWTSELPII
jgi:hypothetical protein